MSGSSSEDEFEPRCLRPKTRLAVVSFIDDDLKEIAEALKDRGKALKKYHQRLKTEYPEDERRKGVDEEEEAKQPKTDEDFTDHDDTDKEKEGGGRRTRRRGRGKAVSTIIKMRRTRFRNQLPVGISSFNI